MNATTNFANDRDALKKAFAHVRKTLRIKARTNFGCCGSCASAELATDEKTEYIFWHRQDDDAFDPRPGSRRSYKTDMLHHPLWVKHNVGNPWRVVDLLREALAGTGLLVRWNGREASCIEITKKEFAQ